jgi:SAM-dependent methyltransferase
VELLDVGCGTKVVKTLLDNSMPIGRYVGIDASSEVIEWLQANVSDPRFEFHHLDAHNAMYNPEGIDLASFELLPVGPRRFDLICLFSVFTHLAPHDYVAMLRLLRRHAKPDARLLFSLFLRDPNTPRRTPRPSLRGSRATIRTSGSGRRPRSPERSPTVPRKWTPGSSTRSPDAHSRSRDTSGITHSSWWAARVGRCSSCTRPSGSFSTT